MIERKEEINNIFAFRIHNKKIYITTQIRYTAYIYVADNWFNLLFD